MGEIATDRDIISGMDWLYLLLIYILLHITRAAAVGVCVPIAQHFRKDTIIATKRGAAITVYGGIRGAVALALALLVEQVSSGQLYRSCQRVENSLVVPR